MFYQAEMNYLLKVLRKMHLQALVVDADNAQTERIDFGLRTFLGHEEAYEKAFRNGENWVKVNTIYKIRDEFMCNYIFLILPGATKVQALLVGPYITFQMSEEGMLELAERFCIPASRVSQIRDYYEHMPVLENEMPLASLITCFGETVWGDSTAFEVIDMSTEPGGFSDALPEESGALETEDSMLRMKLMETRYSYENELMDMVAHGQTHRAETMLSGFARIVFEQRLSDTLRNVKNYAIICNTLMRKAAERGGVHPIYLDKISSGFAKKVEDLPSAEKGQSLITEMVRGYCRLVRKHSMKKYSPIVQKAVACIEMGISNDLGLGTLASMLSVNPSYLSSLFKRETGRTVTEYICEKRMQAGEHLLRTTRLQVQTVAQHCGIPDVNYFSKLFKKQYGVTPKQFREGAGSFAQTK